MYVEIVLNTNGKTLTELVQEIILQQLKYGSYSKERTKHNE